MLPPFNVSVKASSYSLALARNESLLIISAISSQGARCASKYGYHSSSSSPADYLYSCVRPAVLTLSANGLNSLGTNDSLLLMASVPEGKSFATLTVIAEDGEDDGLFACTRNSLL